MQLLYLYEVQPHVSNVFPSLQICLFFDRST